MVLPHIEIIRLEDAFPDGTFGALLISTRYFCMTLEPPEYDNRKNFACIPAGQYECERVISPRWGTTYEICNIPDRDLVRFHPGNKAEDTVACILLGQWLDRENRAIRNSVSTFTRFLDAVQNPRDKFRLTIKCAWA